MSTAEERLEEGHVDRIFGVAHDFPNAAPVALPFLILATPRSGSNMLCSCLSQTRQAGTPVEYLNPVSIQTYMKKRGRSSLAQYLSEIVSRRTSPNGRFGLKLMPDQLTGAFGNNSERGDDFLRGFTRFVRTFRRDKIEQAISSVLAHEHKLWTTTNPDEKPQERGFHPDDLVKITGSLSYLLSREQFWLNTIRRLNLQPIVEVAYEDLVADAQGEVARVLALIGVDIPTRQIPLPKTIKLAGEGSRDIKREYLRAIGLTGIPTAE